MKKFKLLIPMLSSCALVATAVPAVTSCTVSNTTLSQVKQEAIGDITYVAQNEMARQPAVIDKIRDLSVDAIAVVNKCTNISQAKGAGYASYFIEACGRAPEEIDSFTDYFKIVSKILLCYPDDRALAIGHAAGGMYEGMGRKPEVMDQLFTAFLMEVMEIIG